MSKEILKKMSKVVLKKMAKKMIKKMAKDSSKKTDTRLCFYFVFIEKIINLKKEVKKMKILKQIKKESLNLIRKSKTLIDNCKLAN